MKHVEGINLKMLEAFYRFYTKPDQKDSSISIADAMKNFDPQSRWEEWKKGSHNKKEYGYGVE